MPKKLKLSITSWTARAASWTSRAGSNRSWGRYAAYSLNKARLTADPLDDPVVSEFVLDLVNEGRHLHVVLKSIPQDHLEIGIPSKLDERTPTVDLAQQGFLIQVLSALPIDILDCLE